MKRRACMLVGFAALFTAWTTAGQEAAKPKDDLAKLQGAWVVDPAFYKDVKDKEALKEINAVRFIFEGDRLTLKHPPGNEERVRFHLDPAGKPKQIDLSEGAQGIYELEGDTLKLCWDKQAKKRGRPTRFAHGKEDDALQYWVLQREKPR